jgi:hypothetical protein
LISQRTELNCTVTHLALAWLARNPNTSTVILGASKPEQVIDNLKAIEVIPKLTPEIMEKIEAILDNKPTPVVGPTVSAYTNAHRVLTFFFCFVLAFSLLMGDRLWISSVGCKTSVCGISAVNLIRSGKGSTKVYLSVFGSATIIVCIAFS